MVTENKGFSRSKSELLHFNRFFNLITSSQINILMIFDSNVQILLENQNFESKIGFQLENSNFDSKIQIELEKIKFPFMNSN